MSKRRRNQEQRAAFEELQRRKKRKLEGERRRTAEGSPSSDRRRSQRNGNTDTDARTGSAARRRRRRRKKTHKVGLALAGLQAIVSLLLVGMLCIIGTIPLKYMIAVIFVLLLLFGITLATQLRRKGKAIGGKVLSVFLIVVISFGTYYIGKVNGALGKISGGSYKIDNMVVSVLKEDSAKKLSDTADYKFGVQYKTGKSDMETAVQTITEELGQEIELVEFDSLEEEVQALYDKEVDAIIYNEGYTNNICDSFHDYKKNVRVIYEHQIKKEISGMNVDADVKEPFSVYISGIDVYGELEQTSRSDVNIIATVNPKTHQILLVTTPRDYYVPIPGVSEGQPDKLTHAGNHGVDVSMATLEELYDVELPFYARINFTSLITIVDQLGGIDVYSEYDFYTHPDTEYDMHVNKGMNHFDGEQALAFSRERQNVPGGDNQRGKNQEAVITAMIQKMISPQMLMKANGIIDSVSDSVETNMSDKQIKSLIKMQLSKGGSWNIYSVAAEGINNNEQQLRPCYSLAEPAYVTIPDEESVANINDLINRVENGEVLEGSDVVG